MSPPPFWKRVFLSAPEPRLRAGWRLAIQTIAMFVMLVCASLPLVVMRLVGQDPYSPIGLLFAQVSELIAFTLSIFLARRFLDRRSFASLGFKLDWRAPLDILVGTGIAFVMMGSLSLVMRQMGWISFEGFAWQSETPLAVLGGLLLALIIFILTGWNEELLFRGYQLQTLASGLNLFWGLTISSVIFGMLHLTNPHASWVSASGVILAGLFLAIGYLRTGQLWLSIGLHIGWNFFEGPIFGFPVSGLETSGLLLVRLTGPELWTGGLFGPEAGLIIIPALILGTLLVLVYTRKRERSQIQ
ncbi:MAG: CPBP family intramembrane metalloprotease [Anaerolineales bacterium]|nr:CPBP family intramembrane metalloprotease [Anaerolineales bacterium]